MTDEAKREKEITFENIRNKAGVSMSSVITNIRNINKAFNLHQEEIPNIIFAYNNKIIELEKIFAKANIDFYDVNQCKCRFIIENKLQGYILLAENALKTYSATLNVPKEQIEAFTTSYKKPSLFARLFKGAKYKPQENPFTEAQLEKLKNCLKEYLNYYNAIYAFSLDGDFFDALMSYRLQCKLNTAKFDDSIIDDIDREILAIGFSSIKLKYLEAIQLQNLAFNKYSISNKNNIIPFERIKKKNKY